jgi:hypothetical protein
MRSRRTFAVTGLTLVLGVALAGSAVAVQPAGVALKRLKVKAVADDPTATGLISSKWVTHQGLPDAGKSDHALVLKKEVATLTAGSAGGNVHGVKNLTLTELGFDVETLTHCSLVAPRFEVTLADGSVFRFGCLDATTQTATGPDSQGDAWTRMRFSDDDAVWVGGATTTWPGFATGSAQAQAIRIVFDEGTDTLGVLSPGLSRLDNVDVNGKLMGKPGAGGPRSSS